MIKAREIFTHDEILRIKEVCQIFHAKKIYIDGVPTNAPNPEHISSIIPRVIKDIEKSISPKNH